MAFDTLGYATLIMLGMAALLLFTGMLSRKKMEPRNDFVPLILVFILGWFSTDLASEFAGDQLQSVISLSYTIILAGFLLLVMRRLRWAERGAKQGAIGSRMEIFAEQSDR